MDDARINRSNKTIEYMRYEKLSYRFNIPYSPELNPIEFLFSKIKRTLWYDMIKK